MDDITYNAKAFDVDCLFITLLRMIQIEFEFGMCFGLSKSVPIEDFIIAKQSILC